MKINITKKPTIYKGSTKKEVLSKIGILGVTVSSLGAYRTSGFGKSTKIVAYNLIKENAKYKQLRWKTNGKYRKSELIKPKQWIAYVYTFDESFLRATGLHIVQKENNFEYKIKK